MIDCELQIIVIFILQLFDLLVRHGGQRLPVLVGWKSGSSFSSYPLIDRIPVCCRLSQFRLQHKVGIVLGVHDILLFLLFQDHVGYTPSALDVSNRFSLT